MIELQRGDEMALRRDDGRRYTLPARGKGDGLAMIAACRGDDTLGFAALLAQSHMDKAAPDLESADGRVVLMFDPAIALHRLGEKRPGILKRWRHRAIDDALGVVELGACEHALP